MRLDRRDAFRSSRCVSIVAMRFEQRDNFFASIVATTVATAAATTVPTVRWPIHRVSLELELEPDIYQR